MGRDSKKRKRSVPAAASEKGVGRADSTKKPKHHKESKPSNSVKSMNASGVASKRKSSKEKGPPATEKKAHMTKKELRLASKEKAEARKRKRKPHYTLEKEVTLLWEKFRICKNKRMSKEERSKYITETLEKIRGKIYELATSHVTSRILQTCLRFCSKAEKDTIFEELRPHLLTLSSNVYAVHLVNKLLDNADKNQLKWFISSLHGHVSALLRHMVGSVVVEHAFQLGNASQKRQLLLELYSTELQLFKDLTLSNEGRLVDIISKLGLHKSSVLQHMTSVIQPILEKGIVDHSIIHALLVEYFSIADRASAIDVIEQLSGSLLVRMIHTKDGSKVGILCMKHGNAKGRKKIIKAMKGYIGKIAYNQYSFLVLISILSFVDDTKLLTKIVIHELQKILKDLCLDKNGRRPILQLLHPQCQSFLSEDHLAFLDLSIPALCSQDGTLKSTDDSNWDDLGPSRVHENVSGDSGAIAFNEDAATNSVSKRSGHSVDGGKKDPAIRRRELLMDSGLAESLIQTCVENVEEFLFSHFGKDVVYEAAIGGVDGIISQSLSEKLKSLHEAIATIAAVPKDDDSSKEHLFVNLHSSRTIKKLVLNSPTFATILWNLALKGRCEMWAQGHSLKVVSAYLESSDPDIRNLAKTELQPLVDKGIFEVLDRTDR